MHVFSLQFWLGLLMLYWTIECLRPELALIFPIVPLSIFIIHARVQPGDGIPSVNVTYYCKVSSITCIFINNVWFKHPSVVFPSHTNILLACMIHALLIFHTNYRKSQTRSDDILRKVENLRSVCMLFLIENCFYFDPQNRSSPFFETYSTLTFFSYTCYL